MATQHDSNFIASLLKAQAKPIVKEAFLEVLKECNLTLVSTVAPNPSKLLSTNELAEMMGKNRHAIYELVEEGLPYVEEKPYRFRMDDVNNFMAMRVKRKKVK